PGASSLVPGRPDRTFKGSSLAVSQRPSVAAPHPIVHDRAAAMANVPHLSSSTDGRARGGLAALPWARPGRSGGFGRSVARPRRGGPVRAGTNLHQGAAVI